MRGSTTLFIKYINSLHLNCDVSMSFRFQFISPLLAMRMLCTNVSKLVLKSDVFKAFNVGSANG